MTIESRERFDGEIDEATLRTGACEFALIISLVAIVVLIILALLGPAIGNMHSNVMSNV